MATSISLLKPGLKTAIVEGLYNEIQANTNNYYYFLGRTLEWSGAEDETSAPQESLDYEALTREGMVFLKKITSSDISFTIPRYDWQAGTVFDKYDIAVGRVTTVAGCNGNINTNYIIYPVELDISTIAIGDLVTGTNVAANAKVTSIDTTNRRVYLSLNNTGVFSNATLSFTTVATSGATSLENAKFYCITADNNVYKCIDNNNGADSTDMPYGISYKNITTSDGYVWKYMYTIPVALANKFSTLTNIPVTTAIKNQFYSKGTIASTTIVNPGSGYQPGDYLVVTGDGYLRDNVYKILGFNVDDPGYGYQTTPALTVTDPYDADPFVGAVDYQFEVASSGGDLNATTDRITLTSHDLTTGDALTYNNNGNTSIGGLTNAKTYYAIVVDVNTIKLAGTLQNANAGTAIDLIVNDADMYGDHIITKQTDVYLIGQYVKVDDRIYQVTASGTFSSIAPTHTSTEPVYNGTAALKFVGLSVDASVNLSGTSVDSIDLVGVIGYINIQDPGSGYNADNPPAISITGDGSSATAYPVVVGGRVVSAIVANKGSNYSSATVTIDPPVSTATATATVVGGSITNISLTYTGSGYNASTPPAITITGGGGSGAGATAAVANGRVISIEVTDSGSGYTSVPTITLEAPPNTAVATATISGGKVTSINVDVGGDGYDEATPPSVTITGGGGSGATASVAIVDGQISEVNVIDQGSGYVTTPTVIIDPPGIQATALADVYFGYGYSNTPIIEVAEPATEDSTWESEGEVAIGDIIKHNDSYYEVIDVATSSVSPALGGIPPVTSPLSASFNPSTAVNLTNNTIAYTEHGYSTGDAVVYRNGGGTSVGGLTAGEIYFVILVDGDTIKLASTAANATAGTPVDLTSGAAGTNHSIQRVEINGDYYLSFVARLARVTAILQKTQARVVPIIENGQIVGVNIVDGGIGYTTAKITAYGAGEGAEVVADLSIGDLNTNQANVELLAVPGTIDSIEITYPGSDYEWARVDITGDGTGATATATVSGGGIQSITVTNPGSGYSRATVTIIGNDDADQAYARAITSPSAGHGSNAVRELFAKDITLSTSIAKDKNQGFAVDNDYRQLGIIKNPTEFGSLRRLASFAGSTCYAITGNFEYDEIESDTILLDTNSYTVKSVVINDGGFGYTAPTIEFSNPAVVGGVTAAGTVTIDEDGVITEIVITDPGSGYTTAPTITITDATGSGFEGTATIYLQNRFLVVAKPEINPNTEEITLLIQSLDNAIIEAGQTLYVETISPATERTVSLVTLPTVNKYSGDMMYIDNRNAFIPSDEQTISIKTAIRF